MWGRNSWYLGIIFLILLSSCVYASSVRINEVMYNPKDSVQCPDANCEWIELYNNGTTSVDLNGWTLDNNNFESVIILPDEYIIVARKLIDLNGGNSFESYWGNNDSIWDSNDGNYKAVDGSFSLKNSGGDTITLRDNNGEIIDSLTYSNTWGADGNGKTLEFYDGNWYESLIINGTPGFKNSYVEQNETGFVDYVIDGDTVELKTGERVRLVGIDAPELGEYYHEESKNKLKDLVEGKTIILERDIENKDKYDRLLRYIYIDNLFVNLILVQEGYAKAYPFEPNTKYKDEFADAENQAKANGLGIWSIENNCDWQIKILLNKYIFEDSKDVNWTVKVSKNYGEKANVSVRGYVKDLITNWQMNYKPWTNESITDYRNQKYSPNLNENKFYEIFFNITGLSCNDTNLENNFEHKFIMVLPFESGSDYTKIRINELFPDPQGYDSDAMPNGEWIELYNSGNEFLDLENLSLKDNYGQDYDIFISDSNTINGTIIRPKGYLVVYMNGKSILNNDGFEKISLYKNDFLIDEVSYSGSIEGLTWSKINDILILTLPTPSAENFYNESINESILEIKDTYEEKFKFGDIVRTKVYVYKGDTDRYSIQAWIEDKNDNLISKKSRVSLYRKFTDYDLIIPIQIFSNCDGGYNEGEYKVIVEGLGLRDEEEIKVKGNDDSMCKTIEKEVVKEISKSITGLSEKDINAEYNIEYTSKEVKERRLAIYFFCVILIFMLIYLGLRNE